MKSNEFHDYVIKDLFADIPGIKSRPMFGAFGIYKDGKFFGIIASGQLFFKAGAGNIGDYTSRGMGPITYEARGKTIEMSFYEVPEEVMEDRELLREWIQKSVAVASRPKPKSKPRRKRKA